jgi:hypothetical protein
MPSLRYTDGSPPARECRTCGTTHRDDAPCPPVNRWLIARTPVTGLIDKPTTQKEASAA